jgi:hypothetical protein
MEKAPEVDVASAQLELLIVHGSAEKMEAFPVAFYNITEIDGSNVCRPAIQEVIGRSAFLLVFAAITVIYIIYFLEPFLEWVTAEKPDSGMMLGLIFYRLLPVLVIFMLAYDIIVRTFAWLVPFRLARLDAPIGSGVIVNSDKDNVAYIVLPVKHPHTNEHDRNAPIPRLASYLVSPITWFFLIGNYEAISLVIALVVSAIVYSGIAGTSPHQPLSIPLEWMFGAVSILLIGMLFTRLKAQSLITAVLRKEMSLQGRTYAPPYTFTYGCGSFVSLFSLLANVLRNLTGHQKPKPPSRR